MHRRSFLVRCSLAAAGATLSSGLFPAASTLAAVQPTGPVTVPLSSSDRDLLRLLSAYSANVSLVGGGVFTRATRAVASGATQVLALVADYSLLVAFLRSDAEKSLGLVQVAGNTLSFTFEGTAYTVTNRDTATVVPVDANPDNARRTEDHDAATPFTHEALVFHPATNTVSDPYAVLTKHRIDLQSTPTGGIKTRFQTVLHGWLESAQYGLKLGKKFTTFQNDLLGATPTGQAAKKVIQVLLENISALAASFDVDALRPLLTSPLVSASLQTVLGLDADEVLAAVEKLRSELAEGDYTDAALWLATLLGALLQNGTASDWFDPRSGDSTANAATLAALSGARHLVAGSASTPAKTRK